MTCWKIDWLDEDIFGLASEKKKKCFDIAFGNH